MKGSECNERHLPLHLLDDYKESAYLTGVIECFSWECYGDRDAYG